jgi:hypothetical protein
LNGLEVAQNPVGMFDHDLGILRACPKSPLEGLFSKFPEHDFARSNVNGGLGMLECAFIIFGQTSIATQPSKSALNDPTLGEDFEPRGVALDDLQGEAPAGNQSGRPFEKLASISSISENFAHPTKIEQGRKQ